MTFRQLLVAASCFAPLIAAPSAIALEHVEIRREGAPQSVSGQLLAEAADGGLLLIDAEGTLWAIQPDELQQRRSDGVPFTYLSADVLRDRLLESLPAGFRAHSTAHYLICYNTSTAYAEWCGTLYERLFRAFRNFWQRRGLELHDPPQPLVALVFDTQQSYEQYARQELGDATSRIVGYYNLSSNRMIMYDLTGMRGLQGAGRRITSSAQINALLTHPLAERMVATIIHEATHQLAYNCGMHRRCADIPLWVSEGLAVYFETPDLRSSSGWSSIGSVPQHRLERFRQSLATRQPGAIAALIREDTAFRQPQTALDAYAEAWSLNYYLLRNRSADYVRYLKQLAGKAPLVYDSPDQRLAEFQEAFGSDLDALDADFVRSLQNLRY